MQKIINFRGVRLNQRTIDMVLAMERILGFQLRLTQGSYNAGGVTASAGTHDGGGAVDISLKDARTGALFPEVRRERIRDAGRQVGFAAWIRNPKQANPPWPWHVHMIAIGDPDLSGSSKYGTGAIGQVQDYKAGRNGLASGVRDDGPRTWVNMTWEKYKAAHPPVVVEPPTKPTEVDTMTPAQMQELKNFIDGRVDGLDKTMRRNFARILRYNLQTQDELNKANDRYDAVMAAGGTEAQALDAMWQVLAPLDAALAQEQANI